MQRELGFVGVIGGKNKAVILQTYSAGAFAALGDKTYPYLIKIGHF